MPTFPAPETGILLTHFIVSETSLARDASTPMSSAAKSSPPASPRSSPSRTAGSSSTRAVPQPTTSQP